MKKIVLMSISVLLLVAVACDINDLDFENLEQPPYEGLVAIPLGELTYSLRELIDEATGGENSDVEIREDTLTSLLTLAYFDTINYTTGNEIIEIADITNGDTIEISPVAIPGPAVEIIDREFAFDYPSNNNERIDQVYYDNGELELTIFTNFTAQQISYQIEIIDTKEADEITSVTFQNTVNNANLDETRTEPLAGKTTVLRESANRNTFDVNFNLRIDLGAGDEIPAGGIVRFSLTYRNQTFNRVLGYFGKDTLELGNESLDLSFFEELGAGIQFENPQFNMTFRNQVGIPVGMDFSGVYGVKRDTVTGVSDTTYLEVSSRLVNNNNPNDDSDRTIGFPNTTQIGETVESTVSINAFNSTIDDIFAKAPDQLVFDIAAISNPGTNVPPPGDVDVNFFQPNSRIDAFVEVALPMAVQFRDLSRELSFDLGEGIEFDEADSVSMRIVTANLLPFSTTLTLQILNEGDTVLYEAPERQVMATPLLNSNFIANEPEVNIQNIPLSKAGIEALAEGDRVNIIVTMTTPQTLNSRNIYVKLLARYTLEVKVGIVAKLNVDL